MKNYRYLLKNIGLLTISQFGTKLLGFFLIPLYTNVLSTTDYGIYDLINTTISLLIPVLTINIIDASLRFALDESVDPVEIFSISIKYIVRGIIIFAVLLIMNTITNFFPTYNDYKYYFFSILVVTLVNSFFTNFARGVDKISAVSLSSLLSSFVMIVLNILFLVYFKLGLDGYFLATIIGLLVQIIYLAISIRAWKYIGSVHNEGLEEEMLNYSKPLILNSIAWWINNASDRYIIVWLMGLSENGIYSVAYKIPSILNIFQTIFNQAWTLSAVIDFDPEDKDGFFSNMYNMYNMSMVFVCALLIIITRPLAHILYASEFFEAWKYVPFLLIAIVFGSISGYIGGIFSATKQSKVFGQSTLIGAVINIILNILLVSTFGTIGAAISTAIAFYIVWEIRMKHLKKIIDLKLNLKRDYFSYIILVIQAVVLLTIKNTGILYGIELFLLILIVYIFKIEVLSILKRIIRR